MNTYYKVNGDLSIYPAKKYPRREAKKRPKCEKCGYHLSIIKTWEAPKFKRLGYFCNFCKVGFLDKTIGKFFITEFIYPKKVNPIG